MLRMEFPWHEQLMQNMIQWKEDIFRSQGGHRSGRFRCVSVCPTRQMETFQPHVSFICGYLRPQMYLTQIITHSDWFRPINGNGFWRHSYQWMTAWSPVNRGWPVGVCWTRCLSKYLFNPLSTEWPYECSLSEIASVSLNGDETFLYFPKVYKSDSVGQLSLNQLSILRWMVVMSRVHYHSW